MARWLLCYNDDKRYAGYCYIYSLVNERWQKMRHWFHSLPESGTNVLVDDWERVAREIDELTVRLKKLKKEARELEKEIYTDLRKNWTLEEIYTCIQHWKEPDWWVPF